MSRSNNLICILVCTSLKFVLASFYLRGIMLQDTKCQNMWIPTLINFLKDSQILFFLNTKNFTFLEPEQLLTWNNWISKYWNFNSGKYSAKTLKHCYLWESTEQSHFINTHLQLRKLLSKQPIIYARWHCSRIRPYTYWCDIDFTWSKGDKSKILFKDYQFLRALSFIIVQMLGTYLLKRGWW